MIWYDQGKISCWIECSVFCPMVENSRHLRSRLLFDQQKRQKRTSIDDVTRKWVCSTMRLAIADS